MKKILVAVIVLALVGYSHFLSSVDAAVDDSNISVNKCLDAIRQGDYEGSYYYFSSSLKATVSLQEHISSLKAIEANFGKLNSYSYSSPFFLFRHYSLDEDLLKKNKNIKSVRYQVILKYSKKPLILTVVVDKNENSKISIFYLEEK